MRERRRLGLLLLALLAMVGVAAAAPLDDLMFDLEVVPLDNQPAPPLKGEDLSGKPVSLEDLRGRIVLVYFWATW